MKTLRSYNSDWKMFFVKFELTLLELLTDSIFPIEYYAQCLDVTMVTFMNEFSMKLKNHL